jgi:hypothetical protein
MFSGGDVLKAVSIMDQRFDDKAKIKKEGSLAAVLHGISPMDDIVKYVVFHDKYDPTDKLLHPVDISSISDESVIKALKFRVRGAGAINGPARLSWMLLARRHAAMMLGDDWATSDKWEMRWIRRLVAYLSLPVVGADPFVEGTADGVITLITSNDSMVSHRCFMLYHAYVTSQSMFKDAAPLTLRFRDAYEEMVLNMFTDPMGEAFFLKKALNNLRHCVFARSTSGTRVLWHVTSESDTQLLTNMSLRGFNLVHIGPGDNDQPEFDRLRSEIDLDMDSLYEKGYSKLADVAFMMTGATVDAISLAVCAQMVAIEYCGYMRTDLNIVIDETLSKEWDFKGEPAYKQEIVDVFTEALEASKDSVPDQSRFMADLLSGLTTKSAGGGPDHKFSVEITIDGRPTKLKMNNKIMVMLQNPAKFLNVEYARAAHTRERPGHVTARFVSGPKDARPVWMIYLEQYLREYPVGRALLNFIGTSPNHTVMKEGPRTLANHSRGIYASGTGEFFIAARDYSRYDATMRWENVYKYIAMAIQSFIDRNGYAGGSFLGYESPWHAFLEVVQKHDKGQWFELNNLAPQIDGVATDRSKPVLVLFEASGEYVTISFNGLVNEADTRSWIKQRLDPALFSELGGRFAFVHYEVTGDDFISFLRCSSSLLPSDYSFFADSITDQSLANGLDVNRYKVVLGRWRYEYLKKSAVYGYIVPRFGQIQTGSSERPSFRNPIWERFASMRGLNAEYISRGGAYLPTLAFVISMWNLIRTEESFDEDRATARKKSVARATGASVVDERKSKVVMPFLSAFVPTTMGGGGMVPWSMAGSNNSSTIVHHHDQIFIDALAAVSARISVKASDVRRDVISAVMGTKVLASGIDTIQKFVEKDTVRMSESDFSYEQLANRGVNTERLEKWRVRNSVRRGVARAVGDDSSAKEIVAAAKRRMVKDIESNPAEVVPPGVLFRVCCPNLDDMNAIVRVAKLSDRYTVVPFDIHGADTEANLVRYTIAIGKTAVMVYPSLRPGMASFHVQTTGLIPSRVERGVDFVYPDEGTMDENMERDLFPGFTRTIASPMWTPMRWQRAFSFEYGADLPVIIPTCPVAGLDPILAGQIVQMGVSTDGDNEAIDITRAFAQLKRGHRPLPDDITVETLIDILSSPDISASTENIAHVLVMMGVERAGASKFADTVGRTLNDFTRMSKLKEYSTTDMITGHFDMGLSSYQRCVSVPVGLGFFDRIARGMAMNLVVTAPINRPLRSVTVRVFPWRLEAANKSLSSRGAGEFLAYLQVNSEF